MLASSNPLTYSVKQISESRLFSLSVSDCLTGGKEAPGASGDRARERKEELD